MYGMRKMAVILVAVLALVAVTGCEPKSTVTADRTESCTGLQVRGVVTPADATKGVVLQRTVGGKWVDFEWWQTYDSGEPKAPVSSTVNSAGGYYLNVPRSHWGQTLSGTVHFRVRTNLNGGISPSWYTTFAPCA